MKPFHIAGLLFRGMGAGDAENEQDEARNQQKARPRDRRFGRLPAFQQKIDQIEAKKNRRADAADGAQGPVSGELALDLLFNFRDFPNVVFLVKCRRLDGGGVLLDFVVDHGCGGIDRFFNRPVQFREIEGVDRVFQGVADVLSKIHPIVLAHTNHLFHNIFVFYHRCFENGVCPNDNLEKINSGIDSSMVLLIL